MTILKFYLKYLQSVRQFDEINIFKILERKVVSNSLEL